MTLGGEGSVDTLFCMVIYAGCLLAMQVSMKSCSGLLVETTQEPEPRQPHEFRGVMCMQFPSGITKISPFFCMSCKMD